jgi:hypothetical protein
MEIFPVQGRSLFMARVTSQSHLNLSELAPGIYIYGLANSEVKKTGKLLVQNAS